ncbi:MAG: TIGR02710 family CRISPR-associated CARF protein [bacterium]|nr:TIGR02710 family CRISPR-associated CARF protein [bacterium]MDW8163247.1 TIGR02710 family CRISPR-associated CARF protein [Candidatus Omnitrophota bacterium]
MNKKVLIITVGGADEPIVNAIKEYKPDFIYFICSGGKVDVASHITVDGKNEKGEIINKNPCIRQKEIKCGKCNTIIKEKIALPPIIEQADYTGKYEKIIINDPDDFTEVYEKTKLCIEEARKIGNIVADFTGGTKTMSSALSLLCALNFDIIPSLVKGPRKDIIKITEESIPVRENFNYARIDYITKIATYFISHYLYYPAKILIEKTMREIELSSEQERKLREKRDFCDAFYHWDIFEYEKAYEVLKGNNNLIDYFNYLFKILGKTKGTSGYEKVFDLICNAQRQAENGFYDNACARIYRTLELFAQLRLEIKYKIKTGDVDINKVKDKEKWQEKKDKDGKIKIGLVDAYELLYELEDTFGEIYKKKEKELKHILQIRNNSKLAHGDTPITENQWKEILKFTKEFIEECCNLAKIKIEYLQLPKEFI